MVLLHGQHLSKTFSIEGGVLRRQVGRVQALVDFSFEIAQGDTLAVVGGSGSGKSTLAKIVAGLLLPDSGTIHWEGQPLQKFSRLERARRIQMIFQDPYASLNPKLSVGTQLREVIRLTDVTNPTDRCIELLQNVGLYADTMTHYPFQFSGGQRQRIAIARALAMSPELLIADEPLSALDVTTQAQILDLFDQLKKTYQLTFLFITHDLAIAHRFADRVVVLQEGRMVEEGPVSTVLKMPQHPYTRALLACRPSGPMLTLPELIERQANEHPKGNALVFKGSILSFAELQKKVERWAAVLAARGVKAGDSFGLVMRNSPEFVITFFALVRLGARAVPVNFLLKADEISFIFEDAAVVGVITQAPFLGNVLEARKKLSKLWDVIVTGEKRDEGRATSGSEILFYESLMNGPSSLVPRSSSLNPDDVAMIIYTSGTTGKPKGAMLTHKNFISNAEQCLAMVPSLRSKDVFLCLLPMFHSFAWTVCVILPIYLGCKVVIVESIQPFGDVIKQIFRQRATIFVAVPPIYAALLRVPFWWPMRWINPLRICISGGTAALPIAIHQKFENKFGIPLMEGYGLTEASPVVTLNPEKKRLPGSIGKALPGVDLRFVAETGEEVAPGEVGEICIRGGNVMKGYYHQDQATQEAFLDKERLWLRSGDLGFIDPQGFVHISDRKKDLIIVKGLNVYPKEVEDILLEHPAVFEAAVVGVPDDTGDELIRAYVTLKEGAQVDKQELLKLCRGKLAPYKCPKDLEIRKELPKNTLGKILKRELRKT